MMIYLVIAAELAILYTGFWYVYIREPKPSTYKPKDSLWGRYGDHDFTTGGADPTLPLADSPEKIAQWMLPGNPTYQPVEVRNDLNSTHQPGPVSHSHAHKSSAQHLLQRMLSVVSNSLDHLNIPRL